MKSRGFEHLEVYNLSENLAYAIWKIVDQRKPFVRDTVGKQLVRAADSIGANIAEGTGRGTFKDNRHFARIARGSLNETRHFLRRSFCRRLMTDAQTKQLQPLIAELGPRLNAYIKSIGRTGQDEHK